MSLGYSGTPLIKKIGIKPGARVITINAPAGYWDWLSPLPEGVIVSRAGTAGGIDVIHLFAKDKNFFEKEFLKQKKYLDRNGMLWVSWPKKSSKVKTDLDENVIRDFGLANGLVDVKVCAIDETWSGLKFVFRVIDR